MNANAKKKTPPTDTEIRHALRDEARRQTMPPAVLKLVEDNLASMTEHLSHLEKQERFLITQFIQLRPCVWCDSDVSYFEAIPPDAAASFKIGNVVDHHACPHCHKRILYSLPFMGGWFWRKHDDDKNPNRVTREVRGA